MKNYGRRSSPAADLSGTFTRRLSPELYRRIASTAARQHRSIDAFGTNALDFKAIRARLGLSPADFAVRFGFDLGGVEDREQRRRQPERHVRVFLRVIERETDAVMRALAD